MSTAKEHYDNHLGHFYSWMIGNFDTRSNEQKAFFERNNVKPQSNKLAVDLGCGHGLQSVALASLGFTVKAIDFNQQLLDELKAKANPNIETFYGDLVTFTNYVKISPELISCMGDTLTHLQSAQEADILIQRCAEALTANGKLILSFRDLSNPLLNENRFLPVQSDETKIHTCFLEYFEDHVQVYDLLHEKSANGWTQKVSSYPKLKLTEVQVNHFLGRRGFTLIHSETTNRMIYLIAERN